MILKDGIQLVYISMALLDCYYGGVFSKAAPWSNNLSKFHTTSREPRYPLQRYANLAHSQKKGVSFPPSQISNLSSAWVSARMGREMIFYHRHIPIVNRVI